MARNVTDAYKVRDKNKNQLKTKQQQKNRNKNDFIHHVPSRKETAIKLFCLMWPFMYLISSDADLFLCHLVSPSTFLSAFLSIFFPWVFQLLPRFVQGNLIIFFLRFLLVCTALLFLPEPPHLFFWLSRECAKPFSRTTSLLLLVSFFHLFVLTSKTHSNTDSM